MTLQAPSSTYRLGSSSMVCAPGIVRWAINGYAFKRDRENMLRIIAETWGIPPSAAVALLSGSAKFTVDGETVIFTA